MTYGCCASAEGRSAATAVESLNTTNPPFRAPPPSHGAFVFAQKFFLRLGSLGGTHNRREQVGAEHGKHLPNTGQEHLHVFAVRLRQLGIVGVGILQAIAASLFRLLE